MRYRFGDCTLDTDRRELLRNDQPVQIGPMPFDLLVILIRYRDQVLGKDRLLKELWDGRVVSDATLNSHLKAARAAIGDSGEEQKLIRTFNRKGFRFVGEVEEQPDPIEPERSLAEPQAETAPVPHTVPLAAPPGWWARNRRIVGGIAAAIAALMAVVVGAIALWPESLFDAARVPLATDMVRQELMSYGSRPDYKAIALTASRAYVADRQANRDEAQRAALSLCEKDERRPKVAPCLLYASGATVILPTAFQVPLEDLRTRPFAPLNVDHLTFWSERDRGVLRDREIPERLSRVIFVSSSGQWYRSIRRTYTEAYRIGFDVCRYLWRRPCFILAIDDQTTVEVPRSRKVVGYFLPASDEAIPAAQRDKVTRAYATLGWRAVAQGKTQWHAVGGTADEATAIDGAMKKCGSADQDCRLIAIGNFRVSDQ